jgi:hypothetical protein
MWAEVLPSVGIVQGSRMTAGSSLNPGYEVDFDRDVSNCAYHATTVSGGQRVLAQPRTGVPTGVFVLVTGSSGTPTDGGFYLTVTC